MKRRIMKQKTEQEARSDVPFDADATRAKLADVYAVAALGACDAQGVSTAEFLDEFDAFVEVACDAFPKFEEILASPMVAVDEKIRIVDAVCRDATPIFKNFLKTLFVGRRFRSCCGCRRCRLGKEGL